MRWTLSQRNAYHFSRDDLPILMASWGVRMDVCMYHAADLDGHCSGAIWKTVHEHGVLIGLDYGQDVPWDLLENHDVTVVDFCLQPWSQMELLSEKARSVTWIDHHKSAIEEWKQAGSKHLDGVRDTSKAACELTWEFYRTGEPMPRGVFLLGDYDCWRHSDDETMPYQMGMRLHDMDPGTNPDCSHTWSLVFSGDNEFHQRVIAQGKTVLEYQSRQDERAARALWFPVDFDGKRWMAANQGGLNSQFWNAIWDDSFDGKLGFVWAKDRWAISLYSDTLDCSETAKRHGGGGHPGASGFQCRELPFSLPD